jgi:hypothetical protein
LLRPPVELLVVTLFAVPSIVGTYLIIRAQRKWSTLTNTQRPPAAAT